MRYIFEGYALDPDRRELWRGATLIAVEPQVFDLLQYLISHRERVVSRQELIASIWGGRIVSESALSTRINAVRSAIGDSGAAQRMIKTLPRKGVRFVAAVKEEQAPPPLGEAPAAAVADAAAVPETGPAIAQRRQVTVLACELLGDTATDAGAIDVEDLRDVIGAFQRRVGDVVGRFNGCVTGRVGNTLLACFGHPTAHETDADQAVRAALAIGSTMHDLKVAGDLGVRLRAGVSTGVVVIGEARSGRQAGERDIIGDAPHIATRLAALAQPGAVVVERTTRRLVGNLFECRELERVKVTADAEPIQAWQVLKESAVASRFEALHADALSPLIGREEEIELLVRRWEQAKSGKGRVVLIAGEPGIGKSRLIRELRERLAGESLNSAAYFASPHRQDSALYPFVAELERSAGIAHDDSPQARGDKLRRLLQQSHDTAASTAALFAALLALPAESGDPAPSASPERTRELTLQALARRLIGFSRQQPALIVVEDAHWLDVTSLELLAMVVERLTGSATLLLMSFRPEFQPAWTGLPHVSTMILSRLEQRDAAALVGKVAGATALTPDIVDRIVARTDGIPLFVEELTKSVMEEGALRRRGGRSSLEAPVGALPTSLHASLLARLDRLPEAKDVAQIAAVLGRDFAYDALAAVADRPADTLAAALDQLVNAGLVFRRGVRPGHSFTFKHALVQDAAYSTLLRSQRRQLHARVAQALEQQFPETAAAAPEILAYHFTEGGVYDPAIRYWTAAGERALRSSASIEAIQHLSRGVDLIELLPAGLERNRQELRLTLALGQATWTVKGYGPDTLRLHHRARDLLNDGATLDERITILVSLWRIEMHRAELANARDMVQQCIDLARSDERVEVSGHAQRLMGMTLCFMGLLVEARAALEQALALYRGRTEDISNLTQFGAGHAYTMLGMTLWPLGYPDQAVAAAAEGIARASHVGHAVAIGVAKVMALVVRIELGNCPPTDADETAKYCDEHAVRMFAPWADFIQGITLAEAGDPQRGIAVMEEALIAAEAIHAELLRPWQLGYLAKAYARIGDPRRGMVLLDDAIDTVGKTGERYFEAELHRLKGELLLATGGASDAETALRHAITVSRASQSRMWELRATTSLARLLGDSGRQAEAGKLLGAIYAWFTEGFSTRDLREAKLLLDRLG